jgi:transposase-like protein
MKVRQRSVSRAYKNEVVNLVTEWGKSITEVAKDLELDPNDIKRWKKEFISKSPSVCQNYKLCQQKDT